MTILYTIGHSNRNLAEFLALLQQYEIKQLVDVRSIPKSRRLPWFNQENLAQTLLKERITYHHIIKLGGRRSTSKDSINTAWENAGFRGYADYMQTADFFLGLKELNEFIKNKAKTAIMCAEALPWRCHRSLIADAEVIRGIKVLDIISKTSLKEHVLTAFAVVDKNTKPIKLYYPNQNLDFKF